MRWLSITLLLLAGCHTCPASPTPLQRYQRQAASRPQDMTDRVLGNDKYPDWLKRNYAQWIRYAYDLEADPNPR